MKQFTGYRPPETALERVRWITAEEQQSRWNRLLTPLARLFRFNYFWYIDERGRRCLWMARF